MWIHHLLAQFTFLLLSSNSRRDFATKIPYRLVNSIIRDEGSFRPCCLKNGKKILKWRLEFRFVGKQLVRILLGPNFGKLKAEIMHLSSRTDGWELRQCCVKNIADVKTNIFYMPMSPCAYKTDTSTLTVAFQKKIILRTSLFI